MKSRLKRIDHCASRLPVEIKLVLPATEKPGYQRFPHNLRSESKQSKLSRGCERPASLLAHNASAPRRSHRHILATLSSRDAASSMSHCSSGRCHTSQDLSSDGVRSVLTNLDM